MIWPFLLIALLPVAFGIDAIPVTNFCDDYSSKDDCIHDCDCAWCLNTSKCYDVYGSDVDCDASVTRSDSDHCKREATQMGIGVLVGIGLGLCLAILFCGFIFCGAIWAGIRRRYIYFRPTPEECTELT